VFLAPAELESFGLAALEARCAGLPVVARSQAGVGEFVRHGIEGLLGADDDALARATVSLLADPELLGRISRFNRTVPTSLGWADVVDRCMAVYASAAADSVAGPASGQERSAPASRSSLVLS
jgi:glycosyltransferase involved in cell wall biosynthesis